MSRIDRRLLGGLLDVRSTRHPDSEKARALAAKGAEVVAADLNDEESLARAFAGAYGAFCVTNYWEHFSPERELAQAKAMAKLQDVACGQCEPHSDVKPLRGCGPQIDVICTSVLEGP